jgi:hypothetical protein
MSTPTDDVPFAVRFRTPFRTREVLQEHEVLRALQKLVVAGCREQVLLSHLMALGNADPRLVDLGWWTGMSRPQVKVERQRLLEYADATQALLDRPIKAILVGRSGQSRSVLALALPRILRVLADVLLQLLTEASGRKRLHHDIALAGLVRYVQACTGRPHDREVSELVSAVLDREYFEQAHQQWRLTNYPRLVELLDEAEKATTADSLYAEALTCRRPPFLLVVKRRDMVRSSCVHL